MPNITKFIHKTITVLLIISSVIFAPVSCTSERHLTKTSVDQASTTITQTPAPTILDESDFNTETEKQPEPTKSLLQLIDEKEKYGQTESVIYNIEGNPVSSLVDANILALTDNNIIYTKQTGRTPNITTRFYIFDFASGISTELGSINNYIFVAGYDSLLVDDCIYLLITSGNIFDDTSNGFLCIINITKPDFKTIDLGINIYPYNSMTYFNNSIYYTIAENPEKMSLCKYSLSDEIISRQKDYSFVEKKLEGDFLLHISSDTDFLYLLRGNMTESGSKTCLFSDKLDRDCNLLSSLDITEDIYGPETYLFFDSDRPDLLIDRKFNELRQPVFHFDIKNNVLFYLNRSSTRSVIKLDDSNNCCLEHLVSLKGDIQFAPNLDNNNNCFYCFEYGSNRIYCYDPELMKLHSYQFFCSDEPIEIGQLLYTTNGKLLIMKCYKNDLSLNIQVSWYLVDLSDLVLHMY